MVENDPLLDWERQEGFFKELVAKQLEQRLKYWKQRQEDQYLRLYRLYNSF